MKIVCTWKPKILNWFESTKVLTALPPDAKTTLIVCRIYNDSNLKYQICIDNIQKQYQYLKKNKKNRSLTICITKDHTVEFPAASKQFDSLKISLLYDKSDLHTTIYDSDDAKV